MKHTDADLAMALHLSGLMLTEDAHSIVFGSLPEDYGVGVWLLAETMKALRSRS